MFLPNGRDACKKVPFHSEKWKLIFKACIILHPACALLHLMPNLPTFSGSLSQGTLGGNGHFSTGHHLRVPAEKKSSGWVAQPAAWGRFLTELGWDVVWAAHRKNASRDSDRRQWVRSRALLKVYQVKDCVLHFKKKKKMLSLGRVEELQVTESKEQQRRERKKVHNGRIESVGEREGEGVLWAFSKLPASVWFHLRTGFCEVEHGSSLSHALLNMCLFSFVTSAASASNYLANKGWSPDCKDQPLKGGKLPTAHSGRLSWNSIISFILRFFQESPSKPLHLGQVPRGEAH